MIDGAETVRAINSEYAEQPDQGQIQSRGNAYLKESFPRLSYIKRAYVVDAKAEGGAEEAGKEL